MYLGILFPNYSCLISVVCLLSDTEHAVIRSQDYTQDCAVKFPKFHIKIVFSFLLAYHNQCISLAFRVKTFLVKKKAVSLLPSKRKATQSATETSRVGKKSLIPFDYNTSATPQRAGLAS